MSVSYRPVDLELDEKERYALLRTCRLSLEPAAGKFSVVDMQTGSLALNIESEATEQGQDYVAVLDDRAVAISGELSSGKIEFVNLSAVGGPAHVRTELFLPATDLEVLYAPLGGEPLTVVSGFYGMKLYDLSTGFQAWTNTYGPYITAVPLAKRSTQALSDALAVGGTKLIGIVNSRTPYFIDPNVNWSSYGAVGIANLTTPHPTIPNAYDLHTFGFSCDPASANVCTGLADELLHDVTTSPNGRYGVVSGHGVIGVYDLRPAVPTQLYASVNHAQFPHPGFVVNPLNRVTIDSVEASNARAVVIGKDLTNEADRLNANQAGSPDNARWRVTVIDLPATSAGAINPTRVLFDPNPALGPSRAHDVAITPNGARAIVTTRRNTLVLDLTQNLDQTAATEYVTGCDPLNVPPGSPDGAFVSDSVVTTDTYAVVVGRTGGAPGVARACLIDLLQPPGPSAIAVFDLGPATPLGATTPWWVPSDVALDRDGAHAVIRLVDASYPNPGFGNPEIWGRVAVIDLATKSIELNITLNTTAPGPVPLGASQGVDSVFAGYKRVITLGERDAGSGFLQLLTLD